LEVEFEEVDLLPEFGVEREGARGAAAFDVGGLDLEAEIHVLAEFEEGFFFEAVHDGGLQIADLRLQIGGFTWNGTTRHLVAYNNGVGLLGGEVKDEIVGFVEFAGGVCIGHGKVNAAAVTKGGGGEVECAEGGHGHSGFKIEDLRLKIGGRLGEVAPVGDAV
jgi:hypothetical protein